MLCPRAVSPCCVPVLCPRAVSPCCVPVLCPRAVSPCCVPVLCPRAVSPCCVLCPVLENAGTPFEAGLDPLGNEYLLAIGKAFIWGHAKRQQSGPGGNRQSRDNNSVSASQVPELGQSTNIAATRARGHSGHSMDSAATQFEADLGPPGEVHGLLMETCNALVPLVGG